MKKERMLLWVVLFAACQAIAQQQANTPSTTSASQTNAPSASTNLPAVKPKFHWLGPAEPVPKVKGPRLIEGLDTRAWTTVAEDDSSKLVFPDAETHEAGLCLLWWGSIPRSQ